MILELRISLTLHVVGPPHEVLSDLQRKRLQKITLLLGLIGYLAFHGRILAQDVSVLDHPSVHVLELVDLRRVLHQLPQGCLADAPALLDLLNNQSPAVVAVQLLRVLERGVGLVLEARVQEPPQCLAELDEVQLRHPLLLIVLGHPRVLRDGAVVAALGPLEDLAQRRALGDEVSIGLLAPPVASVSAVVCILSG